MMATSKGKHVPPHHLQLPTVTGKLAADPQPTGNIRARLWKARRTMVQLLIAILCTATTVAALYRDQSMPPTVQRLVAPPVHEPLVHPLPVQIAQNLGP